MSTIPQVKVMRRMMRLSQEEFAERFRIPLQSLRNWEDGKAEMDAVSRAYLLAIERDPEGMRKALSGSRAPV
jgi:putative transcriptional regulator